MEVKTNLHPTSIMAYNFISEKNSVKFIGKGNQDFLANPRLLFSFADRNMHVHQSGSVMRYRGTIPLSESMSNWDKRAVKSVKLLTFY